MTGLESSGGDECQGGVVGAGGGDVRCGGVCKGIIDIAAAATAIGDFATCLFNRITDYAFR
jgi:hypothetical protein